MFTEVWPGAGPGGGYAEGEAGKLLPSLLPRLARSFDLIYIDPPYRTGDTYFFQTPIGESGWRGSPASRIKIPAFVDVYPAMETYIGMLRDVLSCSRELLSDTGSIYVHVDHRVSARVRLLLDDVFGERAFMNEIAWKYETGGRSRRFYPRKHDTLFLYAKGKKPYFNIEAVSIPHKIVSHMRRVIGEDGLAYRTIRSGGREYAYPEERLVPPTDIWDDIPRMQQKDPQRTGYDTQKPLKLLERVILASSPPDGLVGDFFTGSGTTLHAAALLGRRFFGVDSSPAATAVIRKRLALAGMAFTLDAPAKDADMSIIEGCASGQFSGERFTVATHAFRSRSAPALAHAGSNDATLCFDAKGGRRLMGSE